MALAANALVSLDEARSFLSAPTSEDAVTERAIGRASTLIESYCDRPLARRTIAAFRLAGPRTAQLYVATAPIDVVDAISVELDGTALTVWRSEADGDPGDFDVMAARSVEQGPFQPDHLFCGRGWWSAACSTQPYNVVLSYTGGFALKATPTPPRTELLAVVPQDLVDAALLTVRRIFDDQKKSVGEVVAVNTPSGGVTLFDRWIPSRAREILDMGYRRVGAFG